MTPTKKKRGRPAKRDETQQTVDQRQRTEVEASKKAKRLLNRFDGMSVDEVMARTLPDVIAPNLDILIVSHFFMKDDCLYTCCHGNNTAVLHPSQIGINPGLLSAYKGHHYPNPGNHFCRFASSSCRSRLLLINTHTRLLCREMSVSVRVHGEAAELLT